MRTSLLALLLASLVACGCSSKAKGASGPGSDPASGSGSASASSSSGGSAAAGGPSYGEKCGDGDACAPDLKCVSYYGIAGASGPEFKSCEKTCGADADCPDGRKCTTIADGPGHVCR
jgi:hypothetical protein